MSTRLAIWTEADARALWCPFGRTVTTVDDRPVTVNEPGSPLVGSTSCIASGCMAWRWFDAAPHDRDMAGDLIAGGDTYGYCGLAGSPRAER